MILVNLMGGLGNQLFQYVAGRVLAQHHNVPLGFLFVDEYKQAQRTMKLNHFCITGSVFTGKDVTRYLPARNIRRKVYQWLNLEYEGKIYREPTFYLFDRNLFNLPSDIYLYGFWQSYLYAENIEEQIRSEIRLKDPSRKYLNALAVVKGKRLTAAMHVRRGDYVDPKSGFSTLDVEYYARAYDYLRGQVGEASIVLFSDDTTWVKNTFTFLKDCIFAADFGLEDYEEMMLMAGCDHQIIANSSFSWWGAWLNPSLNKLVIAPGNWHVLLNNKSELIPPDWVIL